MSNHSIMKKIDSVFHKKVTGLKKQRNIIAENKKILDLSGDRAIEWSWVIANLPIEPSNILDFGSVGSILSVSAYRLGHKVTSIDLQDVEYEIDPIKYIQSDISDIDFKNEKFDLIINCSTIEHVGLEGRYGSKDLLDGDIEVMHKLSRLMHKDSKMILTIPIGLDDCYKPFHRIYGEERLPMLLKDFQIFVEEFWDKSSQTNKWRKTSKEKAFIVKGNERYYALGLFILKRNI